VVRSSLVAERAGLRSVSIVCQAFALQAQAIAAVHGLRDLPLAIYPGVVMTDSQDTFVHKVTSLVVDRVLNGLTTDVVGDPRVVEPGRCDIVCRGTLDEIQELFLDKLWTDGLPIIPPTIDRVERFLQYTDRRPDEVLGVLPPEDRQATIWSVAVNGVMAGCRPEYMPILVAVVEAIADHAFGLEHAGSTPAWEPLITLSGPIIHDLDFNCEAGVLRVGRQANTSVGRFLKLYTRNVAGLRIAPGGTDKGSIGYTFNIVLAENEAAARELGWPSYGVERGFQPGDNGVTVQSVLASSLPLYTQGTQATDHLRSISEIFGQGMCAAWTPIGVKWGAFHPLLVLGPAVAGAIAQAGYSKDDIRQYLYEHTRMPFDTFMRYGNQVSAFDIQAYVRSGAAPEVYGQPGPDGQVPVFPWPQSIGIVVAGDPGRNQSRGYLNNQVQGLPVSKRIELPADWQSLPKRNGRTR
jgi:hypothetical protein